MTENHGLHAWWAGKCGEWVVGGLESPQADADGSFPIDGGSITLSKEAANGVLQQGQSLGIYGYSVRLLGIYPKVY